jgi:hypothetical protein
MSGEKTQLPDQAQRIVEQEAQHLTVALEDLRRKIDSPSAALAGVASLINLRQRYFASTGEHFSVNAFEGILVVDRLDEALLKAVRQLLHGYVQSRKKTPDLKVLKSVGEKLAKKVPPLPERPVAFQALHAVRTAFEIFEEMITDKAPHAVPELELSFVHQLLGLVDRYVQTREKPVLRHFSDIAREYSVVSRLRCACGDEKFEVKMQALHQAPDGSPFDRMDLQCRACGAKRTVTFELPYFKDMYQIG